MSRVRIVTDSTAYLSEKEVEENGIIVVPLVVNFRNESFKEGETYTNEEFYQLLRGGGVPTTSQPSAGDFVEAYQRIAEPGAEIISIHLSAGISGTFNSAKTAAGMLPELDVTVYDSLVTSSGQAFLVREAARMAAEGASKDDILTVISVMRHHLRILFMVDTLEYLHRGGRIGGAQALLGTLLQIKPILYVKGEIGVFEKVRTRPKALAKIVDELVNFCTEKPVEKLRVAVIHVDTPDKARDLAALIEEKFPGLPVQIDSVGPVIGSHVGPGTLGVAFTVVP